MLIALATIVLTSCDVPSLSRHGRVLDGDGRPVAGAEVRILYGEEGSDVGFARTDSAGTFQVSTFSPARAPVRIQICRAGYQLVRQEYASVGQVPDRLRFVLDAAGLPPPGAAVLSSACGGRDQASNDVLKPSGARVEVIGLEAGRHR